METQTQYLPTHRTKKSAASLKSLFLKHQSYLRSNTRKGNLSFWMHLTAFGGEELTLKKITPRFCYRFADYLIQHVQVNSARTYLQKLHALLQEAVRMDYLRYNPMPPLSNLLPRYQAPQRDYLTVNEILRLQKTPCPHESTKLAFLFACYTGLRISDIETLRWEHIFKQNRATILIKTQVKTNQEVRIPLGVEALKILNRVKAHKTPTGLVFHLHSRTTICSDLVSWSKSAGITKHVTFHVARHSFATLSITAGVNLYTVSKLCGHTNIKTTQIYAQLLDTTRFDAIANLDRLFANPTHRKAHINPYDLIL